MTDPNPDLWGDLSIAVVRSILTDLMGGKVARGPIAARAIAATGCAAGTATGLLSALGHLGVVDRAAKGKLRLTVLGRPWAESWLEANP